MNRKKILAIVVFTFLFPSYCLSDEGKAKDPWRAFDLTSVTVSGLTLRYEKSLESRIDSIRAKLSAFLKEESKSFAQVDLLRTKSDLIIERVNKIVGLSPNQKQKAEQRRIFSYFLDKSIRLATPGRKMTVYLVTTESTKDYLRKGGTLPGFSYDKAKDKAHYKFAIRYKSGDKKDRKDTYIVIPVMADRAEKQFSLSLTSLKRSRDGLTGLSLHELIEVTMLSFRLKPPDPYFRWFSDGFANAITIRVLGEFVGKQTSVRFANLYDISKYAGLEKEINLLYWMGLEYCIKTPLESEKRFDYARYCYATHEAVRIINKHGIECVSKILDKACKNERRNDSRNLIPAVKEVTGEDIEKRFLRYQTFKTKAEGIKRYDESFNAAIKRKDYAKALVALLRIHELQGIGNPRRYNSAAHLLFHMGHEAAGDRAILDFADFCKDHGLKDVHGLMHAYFIDYARKCGNLRKAAPSSEIVLKSEPEYVPALAVRMLKLADSGDTAEAVKIARRILKLDSNPKSPWRRMAEKVQKAQPGN